MFGYVTPCKMELKIKDFEKFKAYYCGLCKSIKKDFGNLPRAALNYDMTFLAVLLDSLESKKSNFKRERCLVHPLNKKTIIVENEALKYAAFCNVALAYFKLVDDAIDDKSRTSRLLSVFLKGYIRKAPYNYKTHLGTIEEKLYKLTMLESKPSGATLDIMADPFAELTGTILSSFKNVGCHNELYWLGYNLGKWIYIIDAWDDLEKDIKNNKFNPINSILNKDKLNFEELYKLQINRIDFILTTCARQCLEELSKLPLTKNIELLNNIIQFGLMERMDKVFKRSELDYEKSI